MCNEKSEKLRIRILEKIARFDYTERQMNNIKLFETKRVRTHWDADKEIWYFSVIDVIEILTGSSIPKRYWSDLKNKLTKEGSQLYENIVQLKFEASDGKKYATDCLDTPNLLRLIHLKSQMRIFQTMAGKGMR